MLLGMKQAMIGIVIGLAAGGLSGMFGIGGGILIVPALVAVFAFTQHEAQGTALAVMLMPIGVAVSVYGYHNKGHVHWLLALYIVAGFTLGSFGGSKLALDLDPVVVRRSFAIFLLVVACYMFFKQNIDQLFAGKPQ